MTLLKLIEWLYNDIKSTCNQCEVSSVGWTLDSWTTDRQVEPHWGWFFATVKTVNVNIDNTGNFVLIVNN